MKKKIWLVYLISFISFLAFVPMRDVKADVDYDIDNVNVTAQVESNGSLTIARKIEYSFDSSAHGVYYRQNLNNDQKLLNPRVEIQTGKKKEKIYQGNGENNTYQLMKDNDGYRFKVFHNIKDDSTFTVTYYYTISNAIINWKDIAELNFKIIGNGWDTDLNHVNAKVIINNNKAVPSLQAWAHGSSTGYIKVDKKQGIITLTDDDVAGDSGIELHTIFPTSVTPFNTNIKNENHKQAVISQEKKLAQEANRQRARKRIIQFILGLGSWLVAGGVSIFLIFKAVNAKKMSVKPKRMRQLPRNYEIPSIDVVGAQILDAGKEPTTLAFTAYITALAGKKRIKIEKIKRKNYRISLMDEKVKDENDILSYLFDKVGDGQSFTTKEMRKRSSSLGKKYRRWRSAQFNKVINKGYIDEKLWGQVSNIKLGFFVTIVVLIISIVLFFLFLENSIWASVLVAFLLIDLIGFIYFSMNASYYTAKGAELTNQVRGFKKMLKDIGNFKMRDVGELIFWEEIMPYAVAFNLSDKVIKALKTEFSEKEISTNFVYGVWYGSGVSNGFADSFTSSFDTGIGANSSTSGGSGGFSGGSSGGFGGGSGGGAF